MRYEQQDYINRQIDYRGPPLRMMDEETKYFPGHPAHLPSMSPEFGGGKRDANNQRKQREFIPEAKKDDCYWDRRRRNNEAAKRSREKRRLNDMLLETRVIELSKENHILKAQLNAVFQKYGIKGENMISMDEVMSTMPSNDQVLNFTKKRLTPMSELSDVFREMSPTRISLQTMGHPISIINNNNNISVNNNHTTIPNNNDNQHNNANMAQSYSPRPTISPSRSKSPSLSEYTQKSDPNHGLYRQDQMYRMEDKHNRDDDSGLALNLSTGSNGSRDESRRSSVSATPPVSSTSGLIENNSSGDESGYPRSPNSSSSSGTNEMEGPSMLPHKLRFKSDMSEKEAVTSLLALHQMIKQEPVEHINHWMKTTAGGLLNCKLPTENRDTDEPIMKRSRDCNPRDMLPMEPDNLQDEVARLTSEVATLKNILVNKMRDDDEDY